MTREDKQLLLKDLCARLPYCVKCNYEADGGKAPIHTVTIGLFAEIANREDVVCKPYLRPMSSMTEEEKEEFELLANRCIATSVGFIHFEAQALIVRQRKAFVLVPKNTTKL